MVLLTMTHLSTDHTPLDSKPVTLWSSQPPYLVKSRSIVQYLSSLRYFVILHSWTKTLLLSYILCNSSTFSPEMHWVFFQEGKGSSFLKAPEDPLALRAGQPIVSELIT